MIGITSIAVMVRSSILFCVMQRGGRPLLVRYGRYLHLKESRLADIKRWFVRYGRWGIIVARLIPDCVLCASHRWHKRHELCRLYTSLRDSRSRLGNRVFFLGALLGHELPLLRLYIHRLHSRRPALGARSQRVSGAARLLVAVSWLVSRRLHARPPTRVSAKA